MSTTQAEWSVRVVETFDTLHACLEQAPCRHTQCRSSLVAAGRNYEKAVRAFLEQEDLNVAEFARALELCTRVAEISQDISRMFWSDRDDSQVSEEWFRLRTTLDFFHTELLATHDRCLDQTEKDSQSCH
jgi:hypothetical protein